MPDSSRPRAAAKGLAPAVLALVLVVAGSLFLALEARHLTFSGDDWTLILSRRGFSAGVFLRPHNEHLLALPILAYKVLLGVFGASSYVPFMALLLIVHGVGCLLLYALARRHIGPWAALAPTAILVVLGPAWQDLLWAFQVGYIAAVAAGLGMVLCLERRNRAGDVGATILLAVSLMCSSLGVFMGLLAAVLIALERPRRWRRLWVVAAPFLLYAAWYAAYGVSTVRSDNLVRIPRYVLQALSAALASVTGLAQTHVSPYLVSTSYGLFIAVAVLALLVFHLARGGRLSALGWATLAGALALWTAECLEYFPGGREAAQSRYQYPNAALVLLAIVAVARPRYLSGRRGVLLGVITVAVCVSNMSMLNQRTGFWTTNSSYTAAETGAMEVARGVVAANFSPEDPLTIVAIGNHNLPVVARPYFSAIEAFGSAADTPQGILHRPESVREAADLVLATAERVGLMPLAGRAPAGVVCRVAGHGEDLGEFELHPGVLSVRVRRGSVAELRLRRFATADRFVRSGNIPPPFARARLSAGETMVMEIPHDRAPGIVWRARVVGGREVRLCAS